MMDKQGEVTMSQYLFFGLLISAFIIGGSYFYTEIMDDYGQSGYTDTLKSFSLFNETNNTFQDIDRLVRDENTNIIEKAFLVFAKSWSAVKTFLSFPSVLASWFVRVGNLFNVPPFISSIVSTGVLLGGLMIVLAAFLRWRT